MGKQRQSWSVEEKLAIVLAVLGERQSVAEVGHQPGLFNASQLMHSTDFSDHGMH